MRFLADMGISPHTVEWLRNQGYDSVHLAEEGLQCLLDEEIIHKVRIENRIVLTIEIAHGGYGYPNYGP